MDEEAFSGLRVVELAQWVFVPVAGSLLADWGADVIRVERLDGDPYRGLATQGIGTDGGGINLSVALANRGKRSVALDLRAEQGRAVVGRLLETADVFLTNFRPGALRRLGLDSGTLTARYPRLVYARGHGFGVRGPDADMPGYDPSAFWARAAGWATSSRRRTRTSRSASAARWATATARCRSPSGSPPGEPAGVLGRAGRGVRPADLRRMQGIAVPDGRALGAGAGRRGTAR